MTADSSVLDRLASERFAWVRLAAALVDGVWTQVVLDITTGAAPPGFTPLRWQYGCAVLLAEKRKGAVVARFLRAGRWQSGQLRVDLAPVNEEVLRSDRRASNDGEYGGEPLTWPSMATSLMNHGNVNIPPEPLIGREAPTFLTFSVGVANLLNMPEPSGTGFATQAGWLREQDLRGRIVKVRLHSDDVEVLVEGEGLRGLACELAGPSPGPAVRLSSRSTRVRFPLDRQLQPESWVVLHDGGSWVDRRFLNHQWVRRENDVEVILEPQSRLESLMGGHEGADIEFKRELPKDNDADKRTLMKTVGAFANGGGGTIAFGITDDELVLGLPATSVRKSIDRLVDLVERWVEPIPETTFETIELEGSSDVVLLLTVRSGQATPYCVGRPSEERRVYIRRHGHTRPANQRELRAIVVKTVPREQSPPYGGLYFR